MLSMPVTEICIAQSQTSSRSTLHISLPSHIPIPDPFYSTAPITFSIHVPLLKAVGAVEWKGSG